VTVGRGGGESGLCTYRRSSVRPGGHRHARTAGLFGEMLVHAREDTHVVIIAAHPCPGCAACACSRSGRPAAAVLQRAPDQSGAYISGSQHGVHGGIAAKRSLRSRRPSTHPSAHTSALMHL